MTYTIVIPIYNEERTLHILLNKLKKLENENIDIIIINDGSDDNTEEILKKNNLFIILNNIENIGKGASIQKGIMSAKNQNIILIDGDMEIDIDEIPYLINKFEKGNKDVVSGVRWNKKSPYKYEINTIANYVINTLFNTLYRTSLNDVLCCVKILNTNLFKSLAIQSNGFSIEIEIMAKLLKRKLTIKEVDVNYVRRSINEGKKLKSSDVWDIIWTMLKLKFTKNLYLYS